METVENGGDSSETGGKSREIMEELLDYQLDPGPNTNPKTGLILAPPPPPQGDLQKSLSRFWFSLRSKISFNNSKVWEENKNKDSESSNQQRFLNNKRDDWNLCREEVEMVMGQLGLFCSLESEELKESMGSDDLSQLFDEKEPSLEEVKEAFDVFDENRDGFIDAEELQRVLQKLGLKEGFTLDNCRK
ncbi:hypothetical protein GH714_031956 [Hevea brasiliensis]|uniref:EF-hand domain-containing protein n=1 Tax=Hevea brasiliensis TaxID=3981 RepID=A0A6A6LDE9_HEVBR|nr:hypothetical protein GH714_031956 [Hevea brasiliensis]